MRFSVDANVLFYSFRADSERAATAERIMFEGMSADCFLTNQALGEFLNAIRKKHGAHITEARDAAANWALVFPIAPTKTDQLIQASALSQRHRLQFWDSVILTVARLHGAEWLLTEDMNDGAIINGIRLVNPFKPENADLLDALLAA